MKRFLLPLVGAALLVAPMFASARMVEDLPKTTVTIDRQSRRTVRQGARRRIWRNPAILTLESVRLDALYENEEFRLSVRYPSSWERQDVNERDETLTLPVMFLAPKQEGIELRQNINLVVEELGEALSLREYTQLGIQNERDFFADFAVVSSEPVQIGTYRAHRVVFTASAEKTQMTFAQVWLVRDTQAYVWTFADDSRTFARNIAVFERMLDSMIIR